jgi:hypothetical protein
MLDWPTEIIMHNIGKNEKSVFCWLSIERLISDSAQCE